MQDEAKKDYLSGMKYKDIAEKYEVSINTVKSWKQRNNWQRGSTQKRMHTKLRRLHLKLSKNFLPMMSLTINRSYSVCTMYSDSMRRGLICKRMALIIEQLM